MKLQPDEVWLRSLEAIIGSTVPKEGWGGELSWNQLSTAVERADDLLDAFKDRFCKESNNESH